MGQRMPDRPHASGDDCLCWAPGETPAYVYIRFSGIINCDPLPSPNCKIPPNDHKFTLTQDAISPCYYKYESPDWLVYAHLAWGVPIQTRIQLQDSGFRMYFLSLDPSCLPEGSVVFNTLFCAPFGACAHGGMAVITWTHQATELLEAINMQKEYGLFMELFPLVDGNLIYKFCRKRDATNVLIELEPD